MRFTLFVENAHLLYLALVEDYRILCKCLLVYFPDTLLSFHGLLSLAVDASAHVTIQANRCFVVEFQGSLHFLALLATWNQECRVTANLEHDFLVIGVFYMPDNVNLVAFQTVRDGKIEMIRIILQGLLIIDEGEGETVSSFANQLELCITGEAMTCECIFLAVNAIGVLPQTAYDREEDW